MVVLSRSSGLVGREGFQESYREIPDANWRRAFQTLRTAYAKALRHEARAPLGNHACRVRQGVRTVQQVTAGEDRQDHGAWGSGERHHSTLTESQLDEIEPRLCPFSTLAKTWETYFHPNLELSIFSPFFRAPIDFFLMGYPLFTLETEKTERE